MLIYDLPKIGERGLLGIQGYHVVEEYGIYEESTELI